MSWSLQKGDKVGLIAPSSPVSSAEIKIAEDNVRALGFVPVLGAAVRKANRFLAGSDEERAADVNSCFANPDIKAIFAVRGGYGSARLLDKLYYDAIGANPKPLIGISDCTALQNAIFARAGVASISGVKMAAPLVESQRQGLIKCLMNTDEGAGVDVREVAAGTGQKVLSFPLVAMPRKGAADGFLVGGCLSLVVSLLGTSYMPKLDGNILVLEDVGEPPYKIDRMLNQLMLAGAAEKVAGVIFGNFLNCKAPKGQEADGTVDEVILEYAAKFPCPVAKDFNYGHNAGSLVVPLGARAEMSDVAGVLSVTL